jgi:Zn-finger in ubiquitin-hydrolases and other protein
VPVHDDTKEQPMATCSHLDKVEILEAPPDIPGCEECLKIGGEWVHLRMCQTCGKIGCCDSSPNRHASRHAAEDLHPVYRSVEPGEDWSWCAIDEVTFVLRD